MEVIPPGKPVSQGMAGVLLDLTFSGEWERQLEPLRGTGIEIVGFGPHVDGALMKRGRAAGCTRVMARSRFAVELPAIVARWAAAHSPAA